MGSQQTLQKQFFITSAKTHVDVRPLTIHTSSFPGTSQNRDFQLKDSEGFLCWLNAITISPKKGFAERAHMF
jgi:hypothetical protein